jgi:NAD(P)-dependent dehydrogenase (short-subunit alcohol dehydrogenase family)
MHIKDSVVFVTGANRGLGLAFATEALRLGAKKVYAGVRTPADTDTPDIIQIKLDVTDSASIAAAAKRCEDTTLLVNNAGITRLTNSVLDPQMITDVREIFEINFYGMIAVTQAFAPILATNGGGAIVNVLSDSAWFSRPLLAAYSASKSAAWSFTNALRIELKGQKTAVVGVHVSFMDTGMTHGFEMKKIHPNEVAEAALIGVETNSDEVLVDDFTKQVKNSLSSKDAVYFNPPEIA